jgi:hypothetical protein
MYWRLFVAIMTHRIILGALAVALLASAPLAAHHGSASFDTEKKVVLTGKVTEWLWANPHCFLKFDAKDETGEVRTWNGELGNPTDISLRGYRRNSFKVGDEVTVTLQPFKSGQPVGRILAVELPGGQKF